ncbi:acetyltransferase [Metabacillus litoralis]|uniref:acetyltransferase n=1 Tax=Metabacillus TaxID=2675233 RepID=UPI001B9FF064|nr:acetyltransferase [Metabacillus litoralis]UHA57881.1 acetyltransferase [Metabacillus litoralis]
MKIIIIGHGGHSKVVTDIVHATKGLHMIGYLDNKYEKVQVMNHVIYAPLHAVHDLKKKIGEIKFVIAIGDNKIRKMIVEKLKITEKEFITVIHPTSVVSPSAKVGSGTVVMPNTIINADTIIGNHCILNSGSIVEHDGTIEDFVHICPNSTIAGTVTIGEGCMVGSGATIIPNKKIGEWTTIGAGATVTKDLPSNCLAVGTPAKAKMKDKIIVG